MSNTETLLREILSRLERLEAAIIPPERPPLFLDHSLIQRFLATSEKEGISQRWLVSQRRYLLWWSGILAGEDLRSLSLSTVSAALEAIPARSHRIAVLKRFYSWLRQDLHLVKPEEDPTLHRLRVPQARPAQLQTKKAFSKNDFAAVRALLSPNWRDAADVLAGTGWHFAELQRFARCGTIEERPTAGGAGVLICPLTKGGETLRTAVSSEVLQAAQRVRLREGLSEKWFRQALTRASEEAGVEVAVTPGRFRHSVATWAVDSGEDLAAVASFLGHRSSRTTRRFYATFSTPRKVATLA